MPVPKNMKSIEIKRKVRWADTDASGRIYFPRIFDYVAEGEWELLHGLGVSRKQLGKIYDFPRVHTECHFKKMIELGERFTLRFWPGKLGRTSIRYNFEVFLDEESQETAAEGSMTVVILYNGKPAPIPIEIRTAFAD